jgi:pseudaminic acid cytidylyltransferase
MLKLAVIPARGGSKRIPRKNVKPFAGKPMIAYAICAARDAGVFDRIVVSTDDPEIAAVARDWGAELPFVRPAELSDDLTATAPVMAHAIRALGAPDDAAVCCIYPGVPLLKGADLAAALALYEEGGFDYVFPVIAFSSPIQRALMRGADGAVQSMHPEFAYTRTQDLPPAYFDAGQFYWGRAAAWLAGRSAHLGGRSIVLPEWRAVDIDNADDWVRAEALYAAHAAHAARA